MKILYFNNFIKKLKFKNKNEFIKIILVHRKKNLILTNNMDNK